MRLSTIVACLLLVSSPPALGCIEHSAEQTGWLQEMPSKYQDFAAVGAAESTTITLSLAGAGSAALALVLIAFRFLSRASAPGRARPVESEPAASDGPPPPVDRPADTRCRVDPGHGRPEPARVARDEEALSYALEMH